MTPLCTRMLEDMQLNGLSTLKRAAIAARLCFPIINPSQPSCKFRADASGKTIHVILQATDSSTPSLTRYRRVVIEVD